MALILILCVAAFIWDRFPAASVSVAACIAMVVCGVCSPSEMMAGFINDIVLIVFGTEIFGIAFQESGLSAKTSELIVRLSGRNERSVIIIAGLTAALLSAFLNNQVICALMMIICIHIAGSAPKIAVKNITLPVIYCAVMGGQCTLVGAPATLIASSMASDALGSGISMFEMLPMGLILLLAGMLWIFFVLSKRSASFWSEAAPSSCDTETDQPDFAPNRRKITVTLISGAVMLFLFVTGFVTVGVASVIGALICMFGGAVQQKNAFSKIDWNILIWLGCSVSMASELNRSGHIQSICEWLMQHIPQNMSPLLLLAAFTLLAVVISNFIANTTTVIIVLPFALKFAELYALNPKSFLIAVTMGAGLAVLTPLSSGFIGMTVRVGYRFRDYVRYGFGIQALLTALTVLLTGIFFPVS